jgi:hypothetical protein
MRRSASHSSGRSTDEASTWLAPLFGGKLLIRLGQWGVSREECADIDSGMRCRELQESGWSLGAMSRETPHYERVTLFINESQPKLR